MNINTIEFRWIKSSLHDGCCELNIIIDGIRLVDMLRKWEDGITEQKSIIGAYSGLLPYMMKAESPESLLLKGISVADHWQGKATVLLCGDCGFPGCWDMLASVQEEEGGFVWDNFEQPHRSKESATYWDYSAFGPFRFDKHQYLSALEFVEQTRPEE